MGLFFLASSALHTRGTQIYPGKKKLFMYKINNFKGIKHHKFPVSEEFQTETSEEAVISLCKGSEDLATTKPDMTFIGRKYSEKLTVLIT